MSSGDPSMSLAVQEQTWSLAPSTVPDITLATAGRLDLRYLKPTSYYGLFTSKLIGDVVSSAALNSAIF